MKKYCLASLIILFIITAPLLANDLADSDLDMVPDKDEVEIYYTDPYNRDTDGDGYSDWIEYSQSLLKLLWVSENSYYTPNYCLITLD